MARKRKQDQINQSLQNGSPKKKSHSINENDSAKENEMNINLDLSDICNQKWKVYRVSPLYNFNDKKLKLYEKKLSEELSSKEKFFSNVTYQSKFSLNGKLRLNDQNHEAIQVEVMADQSRNVYSGVFFTWSNINDNDPGFVSLPILLVKGKGRDVLKVHSVLSKMFDCDIMPVLFSFTVLVLFFVKFLETPRKKADLSQECISLEYKIPGCGIRDSLKAILSFEDTIYVCAVLIDSFRKEKEEATEMEVIFEIYYKILHHIHSVHKMDLFFGQLYKVVYPDAVVSADGVLKLCSNNIAMTAFNILQQYTTMEAMLNPYNVKID